MPPWRRGRPHPRAAGGRNSADWNCQRRRRTTGSAARAEWRRSTKYDGAHPTSSLTRDGGCRGILDQPRRGAPASAALGPSRSPRGSGRRRSRAAPLARQLHRSAHRGTAERARRASCTPARDAALPVHGGSRRGSETKGLDLHRGGERAGPQPIWGGRHPNSRCGATAQSSCTSPGAKAAANSGRRCYSLGACHGHRARAHHGRASRERCEREAGHFTSGPAGRGAGCNGLRLSE
mmetsp:Transcript_11372/g.33456  ORF Transcript_11372/g.33456 Transcript_11372/m.33456 type:complete len:236 (-) Transcript_11372:2855-3562(-)